MCSTVNNQTEAPFVKLPFWRCTVFAEKQDLSLPVFALAMLTIKLSELREHTLIGEQKQHNPVDKEKLLKRYTYS